MNQQANNLPLLVQRLNSLAWPIKCYWAKHFPIKVITTEPIDVAAMDFKRVYMHPTLVQFNDDVLFCMLAHEWAHRMVSPKSIDTSNRIIEAVAKELHIDFELAQLVSDPAIELIVDRSNCEIELWKERYRLGFIGSFTYFTNELEEKNRTSQDLDPDILRLQQMILALRMANVSLESLPAFIAHLEDDARKLVNMLFENWHGHTDPEGNDHIRAIIRFAKAFYEVLPQELLNRQQQLRRLLKQLRNLMTELTMFPENRQHQSSTPDIKITVLNHNSATEYHPFNINLTRQVTDHLFNQAHKARQITGLWQPGHALSKLDVKRSFRASPQLISGITTRKKTDSNRMHHCEKGNQLRFCLLVDDSGSMSGDEAMFSRSICEGINRFAARKDLHIGLVTFGSEIDVSFPPERRYHRLTSALSRLDGNLGGTNLQPALKQLSQYVEADRDISHAILITDADISDWADCRHALSEVLQVKQIKIIVLIINNNRPEELLKSIKLHREKISFFAVDPSKRPDIAILKEMIQ